MIDFAKTIANAKIVDLSHEFYPGIPHAVDMPDEETAIIYDFEQDGFQAHYYKFAGQWGTHIDAPVHFIKGGRALNEIEPKEFVLPLVVIDCIAEVAESVDYLLDVQKIKEHESKYGIIPEGSFVAMKTGWSKRWPNPETMSNKDSNGIAHFPGWSVEAATYLIELRNVSAFAHEPTDTDGGVKVSKDDFDCETYILSKDRYQIEMLAALDLVPPTGSLVFVGTPKPRGGSGFPARVLAVVPT